MPQRRSERKSRLPGTAARRALLRFVAASVVVLIAVGIATVLLARTVSRDVALRHAKERGVTFAQVVSAPLVDSGVRNADPERLGEFTEVMENRLQDRSMVHIKVWDPEGHIIWADTPGLRGEKYTLEAPVRRLFDSGGAIASLGSNKRRATLEPGSSPDLLDVYVGTRDAQGAPILVESAWSTDHIDEDARAIMLRLAPVTIGALLLFAAVMLPLALSFARRVETAQTHSETSLKHALAAADLERRRIARDLHDGVMQDVGGAGYALAAAVRALPDEATTSRGLIDQVRKLMHGVGGSLRDLLADIYPPNLERDGLSAAVQDLGRRARLEGVEVDVVAGPGTENLPLDVTQLCYRITREAMRNVMRHAQASHVLVSMTRGEDHVVLSIADNGRGLPAERPPSDHHGLRLLDDTLHYVGGTLSLESPESGGAVLTATVPLVLAPR
jgi:signal transduction histidine kinase